MSLTDALLNEGHRDPHSVYIALRSDQQRGSGTINDPYDGGTRLGPAMAGSLSFKAQEFVLGFSLPQPLEAEDIILFKQVHGVAATWFNNRRFKVKEKLSNLHLLLSFDYLDGGGSMSAPPGPPDVPFTYHGEILAFQTDETNEEAIRPNPHLYWPVARATVPGDHGLGHFEGVTVGDIGLPDLADLAGDYPILGLGDPSATRFYFRLNSRSTLPSDVSGVACTVKRRIYRFDEVMRSVPIYSVIHLGPGTFETRGVAGLYPINTVNFNVLVGFALKAGHRMLGAGIDVTVVRLVLPLDEINQTTAIGSYPYPLADSAEVGELTVDCNAPGHAAPYGTFPAPVTCGAIGLGGSFIRISRVRAINFCVQGRAECFVIALSAGGTGSPPPRFNVIEDCIVEKPGENNTHETTLISNFGDSVRADAVSPIVRRNYHNCEYSNGQYPALVPVASLQRDAVDTTLAILTTSRPHTHVKAKALVVQGAKVGGDLSSIYNGIFTIEDVVSATVLRYRLSANPGTGSVDVSSTSIGWPISSEAVAVASLSDPDGNGIVTLTTRRAHNLLVWQNVLISYVTDPTPGAPPGASLRRPVSDYRNRFAHAVEVQIWRHFRSTTQCHQRLHRPCFLWTRRAQRHRLCDGR